MLFSTFEGTLGGIGLFLLGMRLMSDGIRSVADDRIRRFVVRMVSNRFFAVLFGMGMTCAVSSGSAGVIFTIGLLNGGVLTAYQAICVLVGVLLGSALSLHLHLIPYSVLSGPLILGGVLVRHFSGSRRLVYCATLLLGVGLLFLGLSLLEGSSRLLDHSLLYTVGQEVIIRSATVAAAFFGAVISFLVQSAQSTITIITGLDTQQATVTVSTFAMTCGSIAGMAVMGLLASVGGNSSSRRVAALLTSVTLLVNVPCLVFATKGAELSVTLAALFGRHDRQSVLSFSYTLPCVLVAVILLIGAGWVSRILKTMENASNGGGTGIHSAAGYLDARILSTPSIALEQARKEIFHMANVASCMFADVRAMLSDFDARRAETIRLRENLLDSLNSEITSFLAALSNNASRRDSMFEVPALIQVVSALEHIGDASEDILDFTINRKESGIVFSADAMENIFSLAEQVAALLSQTEKILVSGMPCSHEDIHRSKKSSRIIFDQIKKAHFDRICAGTCPPRSAMLFQEIVSSLIRIAELCWTIMEIRISKAA